MLYSSVSGSILGRRKGWERIETYASIFTYYEGRRLPIRGSGIIEVGSGNQFFTALYFLKAGARRVILVEPKLKFDIRKLERELETFNRHSASRISLGEAKGSILCFGDMAEIPHEMDDQADLVCSYLVLEHFREIESFFENARRLLRPGGTAFAFVDLSDHTYHVFGKYPFLREFATRRNLYHLRYSDRAFGWVNDSKCYMNRKLVPEYVDLAGKHGLRIADLSKQVNEGAVVSRDLARKYPSADPVDLKVVNFTLSLEKPAAG